MEGCKVFRNGPANILETSTSKATGKVRQITAHTGPTSPVLQNRSDNMVVTMIRPMVARLALPAALLLYMTTK